MGHFFNSVRSWYLTKVFKTSIQASIPDFDLSTCYVKNEKLEETLKDALLNSLRGVHVFWVPEGSCNSTALYKVANSLLKSRQLSGVIVNRGHCNYSNFKHWYNTVINVNLRDTLDAYPYRKKPLLIILDNVDKLITIDCKKEIVALAQESIDCKKFVIVIVIRNLELARIIKSWNDGKKIHLITVD